VHWGMQCSYECDPMTHLSNEELEQRYYSLLERVLLYNQTYPQKELYDEYTLGGKPTSNEFLAVLIEAFKFYFEKKYDECIETLSGMLAHSVMDKSSSNEVLAVLLLVKSFRRKLQYQDALELIKCLVENQHIYDVRIRMGLHWAYGDVLIALRHLTQAAIAYSTAHKLSLEVGSVAMSAQIYVELASATADLGDVLMAITMYEQALLTLSCETDHDEISIFIRMNLAASYPSVGRDAEALDEYTALLSSPQVSSKSSLSLPAQLNTAMILKRLGQTERSIETYRNVIAEAKIASHPEFEIRAFIGLADHYLINNQITEARLHAKQALELARLHKTRALTMQAGLGLASVDYADGRHDEAIQNMTVVFDWFIETGDVHSAIVYGPELAEWMAANKYFNDAFNVKMKCAELQKAIYDKEVERTIELTSLRSRLDHERDAIRTRDEERNRILNAVLPQHIAQRLMSGETQIADRLPSVTLLFIDIVGFTRLATSMIPEELVLLLEHLFTALDTVCLKHRCERIKTVGDSYMAICGASTPVVDHVQRMCRAALEIVDTSTQLPIDSSRLRIGLHTGPVVAGVMSGARLSYDVWGDTVNVAARMEQLSEPGRILCSNSVAEVLSDVAELSFEKREPLDIKGKGLMSTYWLSKKSII